MIVDMLHELCLEHPFVDPDFLLLFSLSSHSVVFLPCTQSCAAHPFTPVMHLPLFVHHCLFLSNTLCRSFLVYLVLHLHDYISTVVKEEVRVETFDVFIFILLFILFSLLSSGFYSPPYFTCIFYPCFPVHSWSFFILKKAQAKHLELQFLHERCLRDFWSGWRSDGSID